MQIPTWRVLLTGGAITVLAVAGLGFAAASNAPAAPATDVTAAEETAAPGTTSRPDRPDKPVRAGDGERLAKVRDGWGGARLLRLGRHLVHAEVTVTGKDGELINLQLDHGTVQSIGGGSLTIAEAGGATETVSTDDATVVWVGREDGVLGDVVVGAEIFVQSRVDGSTVLAKRILVVPARD